MLGLRFRLGFGLWIAICEVEAVNYKDCPAKDKIEASVYKFVIEVRFFNKIDRNNEEGNQARDNQDELHCYFKNGLVYLHLFFC